MQQFPLRCVHLNRTSEQTPYQMDQDQARGLMDLFRFYGPRSVFRQATACFGPGGGFPGYSAHGSYFDYDHVLRNLTRRSGFESAVGRTIQGGGKGHSLFGAFASTLGELVERVLGCLQGLAAAAGSSRFGTCRDLRSDGLACTGPDVVSLFAPEQYEDRARLFDPFTDDSVLRWIEGRRLFSGATDMGSRATGAAALRARPPRSRDWLQQLGGPRLPRHAARGAVPRNHRAI